MSIDLQPFLRLAVALAIGLLIGIERGWKERNTDDGRRVSGLRTFGLIGLLGGMAGLLGDWLGQFVIGMLFIGLSVLLAAAYMVETRDSADIGLTTEIAALGTFLLTTLAGLGQLSIAAAGGVVMALLLSYKSLLHGWLSALQRHELTAGIQLLLMSVVLLPLLPNRGFGPGEAVNPYEIWWMVVLIAALSFIGYCAIRIAGPRAGTIYTSMFGGLASSTALTLTLARLATRRKAAAPLLAGGILLACGTMFPRLLLVATVVEPLLFSLLVWPVVVMAVPTYAAAIWLLRRPHHEVSSDAALPSNPLELSAALSFGALLTLVMLLSKALTDWFGDAGVWALAAASGVADVDAITLTLSRMSGNALSAESAAAGITIAATVNSLVKVGLALSIGGRAVGMRVAVPLATAVLAGLAVAFARLSGTLP